MTHREFVDHLVANQSSIYRLQPKELVSHFKREESVVNSYRGRQVLELLQNADDAGNDYIGQSRVLLQLGADFLAVANTGEPFSRAGFESLSINDYSPKQLERTRYIGNKGLGFGSVLSWSSSPLVLSGGNAMAFRTRTRGRMCREPLCRDRGNESDVRRMEHLAWTPAGINDAVSFCTRC